MSAFTSLIILIAIAALSMGVVAYSNYQEVKKKQTNQLLEKMKRRAEEIEDIVITLDKLCETRRIPRLMNNEVVAHYEAMLQLNPEASYLRAGLSNAQLRSNEFEKEPTDRFVSRVCKSDAEIARNIAYLDETLAILQAHHVDEKISNKQLNDVTEEMEWLRLQLKVVNYIVQGHKAYIKEDTLSANAFYEQAQAALKQSSHPDERRDKMINQLSEILSGQRRFLDPALMPEKEFNPDEVAVEPEPEEENKAANTDGGSPTTPLA